MRVGSQVSKQMQQSPTILRPAVHYGRDTPHNTLENMRNLRAWPNNVGRAVQTDPTLLGYASVITKQKHPKTCNRVCKRAQDVTSNIVASVCMGLKIYIYLMCTYSACG